MSDPTNSVDDFTLIRTCNTKQEAAEIESRLDAVGIYPRFEQSTQFSKSTCCSCGTPLIDLLVRYSQKGQALQVIEQMELQLEQEALSSGISEEKPRPAVPEKQQYHLQEKDHTANVIFNGLAVFIAVMIIIGILISLLS
ncbi:MAG: hypothetical protein D6B28_05860 [Gammaproteobacteria bacterium]|nr:MAG: hypothetical protein D6B28_05860 [Gammaproteobacteria bacterium]